MKPPLCEYEVFRHEWKDKFNRSRWDAVAMIRPCGHAHFYSDFDERLKRFNRELHLGFDMRNGRWCIYRWMPECESLGKREGMSYVHRYMDIIFEMKWMVERKRKDGSKFYEFLYREPGDWVFSYLRDFKPGQLLGYNYWMGDALKEQVKSSEEKSQREIKAFVEDWAGDVMSLADRGNPERLRTSVRVEHKPEPAKA